MERKAFLSQILIDKFGNNKKNRYYMGFNYRGNKLIKHEEYILIHTTKRIPKKDIKLYPETRTFNKKTYAFFVNTISLETFSSINKQIPHIIKEYVRIKTIVKIKLNNARI